MTKNLPGSIPSQTLGVLGDIFGKTAKGVFTHDELALFAKRRNPFPANTAGSAKKRNSKEKKHCLSHPASLLRLRDHWIEFWKVVGGRELTDAELVLPAYQLGFDWPIVAPPQVGNQAMHELIKRFSPTSPYWADLNQLKVEEGYLKMVDTSSIVLIKPSIEPDLRLSYNDAVAKGIFFISLRQYLAFVAFLGWLFKNQLKTVQKFKLPKHLDVASWTRTASLVPDGPDGGVALGGWRETDGGFWVHWSDRGFAGPGGGIRQAVC